MFGKKSNNTEDDFDFDTGDEFFDLGDPFGSQEPKPPKGVKGYLKNVAKSVKNIGVKLGKNYLPEADYLLQDLKEKDEDNPATKWTIDRVKKEARTYSKIGSDLIKDVKKDVKNSVKTGYFFKSDEDSFGGDLDFGGDFDLGEISDSGFDDNQSIAVDASQNGDIEEQKRSRRSGSRTARAQTIAQLRMHDDTINATVGATQAHIRAESSMFNQNLLIESEHHRQKMLVMKNIASNVGKIIKQNNISIKAQMEYSLKSLAFANDTAAMIKEIRDMQWKAYTPKEDNTDYTNTAHKRIFGNGFNKKEWIKNFKSKFVNNAGGGLFSNIPMFKDMLDSTSGLGISPASLLKSMAGDTIFSVVSDALIPSEIKQQFGRLNDAIEGAPTAINNILGSIYNNRFKENGAIDKILKRLPFGDKIRSHLQNMAGYAHQEDIKKTNTGRFNYTADELKNVHPFDNLAHKTLTETIPRALWKIEAGINNHKELMMDPTTGQLRSRDAIKEEYERAKRDTLQYSTGYEQGKNFISGKMATDYKSGSLKNISESQMNKISENLIANLYNSGTQLREKDLEDIKNKNSIIHNKILDNITKGTGLEDLSNEQKEELLESFTKSISDYSHDDNFVQFSKGMSSYANRFNTNVLAVEEKYGKMGLSSIYNDYSLGEQFEKDKAKLEHDIKIAKDVMDAAGKGAGSDNKFTGKSSKFYANKRDYWIQKNKELKDLVASQEGVDRTSIGESGVSLNSFQDKNLGKVDKWELKELTNNSQGGIINNIYKLLLDGVIVYPRNEMSKEVARRNKLRGAILDKQREIYNDREEANAEVKKQAEAVSAEEARAEAQKRLDRLDMYKTKSAIREKADQIPFIRKLLKGADFLFDKGPTSLLTSISDIAEHELYGKAIDKDSKGQQALDKIDGLMNGAIGKYDEYSNLVKEEGFGKAFKTAAGDIRNSKPVGIVENTGRKAFSTGKSIAKGAYNNAKDIYNETKEKGFKAGFTKGKNKVVSGLQQTKDSLVNNKYFQKIKEELGVESQYLDEKLRSKAETNKFINKLVEAGDIVKESADEIKNVFETEGKIAGLKKLGEMISNSKPVGIVENMGRKAFSTGKSIAKGAAGTALGQKIINSGPINKLREKFNNAQGRQQGTLTDQILDAKEKKEEEERSKQTSALTSISDKLNEFFKNGFKLNKETVDKLDESNKEAAEVMSEAVQENSQTETSGLLGKVSGLIDKTGLGDTKAGQTIKNVLGKAQGVSDFIGKSKIGSSIKGKLATGAVSLVGGQGAMNAFKYGGLAGLKKHATRQFAKNGIAGVAKNTVKNIASGTTKGITRGATGILKAPGNLLKGAGKSVVEAGKAQGGLLKKFIELVEKIIKGVVKQKKFANAPIKAAWNGIKNNLGKIAGKIMGKISTAMAWLSSFWGGVAKFAAGFTLGLANTKKTLNIGKDMKPTLSMRLICATATALDTLLSGVPTIVAKFIFKYKNFAQWLYSKIGSKAEKAALERYNKYCSMKSIIYGISDFSALIEYENRNIADRAGRKLLSMVTFGLAKSNDEKDASMLGFTSVKIFKYWKEKKYEPLEKMRKEIAENYGGLKVVEKTQKFTADVDEETGEIDEDDKEKAEEQQKAIENQQAFRVDFLKQARKWVVDNKLAWLNNKCTVEDFEKRTGKKADTIKSAKQKLKAAGKKVGKVIKKAAPYAIGAAVAGPLGVAAVAAFKNRKKIAKAVKTKFKNFSAKAGKALDVTKEGLKKAGSAIGNFFKKRGEGIANSFKKMGEDVKNLGKKGIEKLKSIGSGISNMIKKINEFINKFIENKKIQVVKGINKAKDIFKNIIKALTDYCAKSKTFSNKLKSQLIIFTVALPVTVTKAVASFIAGRINPGKQLGFDVAEKTDKIKLIGGLIAMIKSVLPSADEACVAILGKTLKRVVFDAIMKDDEKKQSDTFLLQKAKILGLEVENMLKYENKLNEDNFGKKALNFMKNIFGGGADKTDANICGFKSVKVFKFWREEKFEPLRNLEETTAHKFGDIDDLRSETPKDPEMQKKFRQAYLREAQKYVKERGLEWLTYKTTDKELEERKKNKTLYLKSDKQYKNQVSTEENSKNPFKRFKNFFFSSNRDTRGKAKQVYQVNNKNTNYVDIDTADVKAMEESIRKEYKYDKKAMNVMAQASASIKSFWKSISPNFYGDQPAAKVSPDMETSGDKVFGGKGGALSTGEGLITRYKDRVINMTTSGIKDVSKLAKQAGNKLINQFKNDDGYGLNGPKINRAKVMNSIVNDFAKNFGTELNKRLDVLEEMHKESIRHNKVSEDFFIAALSLMKEIASKSGSGSAITSSLDSAISALIH